MRLPSSEARDVPTLRICLPSFQALQCRPVCSLELEEPATQLPSCPCALGQPLIHPSVAGYTRSRQ